MSGAGERKGELDSCGFWKLHLKFEKQKVQITNYNHVEISFSITIKND